MKQSIKNAIEVQNVTKVYGVGENSVTALKDANLTINDNEFFTLSCQVNKWSIKLF